VLTRRTAIAVPVLSGAAASTAVLAGCSSSDTGPAEAASPEPTTRTVHHVYGTTEVPVDPQRVVCLDGDLFLEPTLALGIEVIAAGTTGAGEYSREVAARLPEGYVQLANKAEVNLEEVIALDPDLVVVPTDGSGMPEVYQQLSSATAAVGADYDGLADWPDTLRSVGRIFDREQDAELLLAEFTRAQQEVAADLGHVGTLSIVRVRSDGRVSYLPSFGTYPWTVFGPLGVQQPPQQETGDERTNNVFVSFEELQLLDADTILVLVDSGAQGTLGQLDELSTWTALLGRKVVVDSPGWLFGNVLTARTMLTEITRVVYP
jgi:iron complex transport system substrate-binding protein